MSDTGLGGREGRGAGRRGPPSPGAGPGGPEVICTWNLNSRSVNVTRMSCIRSTNMSNASCLYSISGSFCPHARY